MLRRSIPLFIALLLFACPGPDTTPPQVSILVPNPEDTVRAVTGVKARATDNRGVAEVRLFVDGRYAAGSSTPVADTFTIAWNTSSEIPGAIRELRCVALDLAGNADTSAPVPVVIDPDAGTVHRGTIAADETWSPADNPHVVATDLAVEATLTILPGVTVLFRPGCAMLVGTHHPAALVAAGRPDSAIYFGTTTVPPAPGSWRAVEFRPRSRADANRLSLCRLEHGGGDRGMVYCESTAVRVEACTLNSARGAGIVVRGGRLASFRNNAIRGCGTFPLQFTPDCAGTLTAGNDLRGNGLDAVAITTGTVTDDASWPDVGLPYLLLGTVAVAGVFGPVLTVSPGCSLLFADSAALRIGIGQPGALHADGNTGTVVFAGAGDAGWPGIEFWENTRSERTILNNCLIDGAGRDNSAALFCYRAGINLSGSRIRASRSAGLYLAGAGFGAFQNNTITGCQSYPVRTEAALVGSLGAGNSLNGNSVDAIEVAGGTISADAVWQDHGVPYLIRGNLDVGSALAPRLTLVSGVELRFAEGGALRVGQSHAGALIASGAPDSITFTATTARPGAWRGIEFHQLSGRNSVLSRCRVVYAGGNGPGEIYTNNCQPRITNCEIGWSANYCVALFGASVDPDSLREQNWLHDWNENYDDIYYEP